MKLVTKYRSAYGTYTDEEHVTFLKPGFDRSPYDAMVNELGLPPIDKDGGRMMTARLSGKKKEADSIYGEMVAVLTARGVKVESVREDISPKCNIGRSLDGAEFGTQIEADDIRVAVFLPCESRWEKREPVYLGETTEKVMVPRAALECEEVIQDLQEGNNYCYTSTLVDVDGWKLIFLYGNGWADKLGFPFDGQTYPCIRGATRDKILKAAKKDEWPNFKDVWSRRMEDLVDWEIVE